MTSTSTDALMEETHIGSVLRCVSIPRHLYGFLQKVTTAITDSHGYAVNS